MAVSLACIKAMEERLGADAMPHPMLMAGHSLGEYTALAAAGVLNVAETAHLVNVRSELMQVACDQNPGTMAAIIGLDEMPLEEIARETGTFVSNVNTAEQIVISGERIAVAQAMLEVVFGDLQVMFDRDGHAVSDPRGGAYCREPFGCRDS